jgi:hypothetical protein
MIKRLVSLYRMGNVNQVLDPMEPRDPLNCDDILRKYGYALIMEMPLDYPKIKIWQRPDPHHETYYSYYAQICFGLDYYDEVCFDTWFDLIHFLQNYTGWIVNLEWINYIQANLEK